MKRMKFVFLIAAALALLLSGCYMINGLLLSDEALELVGLWYSEGWDYYEDTCHWDFRADGRVFVTDWTDDLETTNNPIVPIYFNWSVKAGLLKMTQFGGIVSFEFEVESFSDTYYSLTVTDYTSDYDFDNISYGEIFYLSRRMEYSREVDSE